MIKKLKPKSEFLRNVLTLMTGTTIAQAIPIAISPILTRIYTPEDFGLLALYLSMLGLVSIIATGRYEIAIILPKKDNDAINLLFLSVVITLALTVVTTIFITLFHEDILFLFNAEKLGNGLYLLPLSLFLGGIYQGFSFWTNRNKRYSTLAKSRIVQSSGVAIGQVGFGYANFGSALLLGNILGRISSVITLVHQFILHDRHLVKNANKESIIKQMREYKEFPLINSLHAFSDVAKSSFSILLIAAFFGNSILGFYSLAIRILQTPLMIIGSSIGQVLYQELNSLNNNKNNLHDVVTNILIKLALFALPIFTILYFFAPKLFSFIFGSDWEVVGEYIRIMIPYLFLSFLVSPISQVPIILKRQKTFFKISLVGNIGMPLLIYFGYHFDASFDEILFTISIFFSAFYMVLLYWILSITRANV